ncbi:MAG TPA: TetR/AcrR family transcriptional regulator [Terriglobia bacterium]|nr:TetR/AcrR family transcriptional regulator [Terriglobia bacterium]
MAKTALPTRSRILESGANLLSTCGLSGITLGTLAEETGMSKSGLFAHFGSKEEVQLSLLEHTAQIAGEHVVAPAMLVAEGLPRLKALVKNWLGWAARAGLAGGCPVAAGLFELDDTEGPVRERLLQMEKSWRVLLARHVAQAIELGHLRSDLDIDQFVWELCGIYLSHHASARFVRDPKADKRARIAFDALLERALPKDAKKNTTTRRTR